MSSSPSRAQIPSPGQTRARREDPEAVPFFYGEVAAGRAENVLEGASAATQASQSSEREAQARALGRQAGELEARKKFEEQLARERAAIAAALIEFAEERAI